jgi:hypothetical protein
MQVMDFSLRGTRKEIRKKVQKILAEKPKATDHFEDPGSIKWMLTEYSKSSNAFI